jgi:hypothetical protein
MNAPIYRGFLLILLLLLVWIIEETCTVRIAILKIRK